MRKFLILCLCVCLLLQLSVNFVHADESAEVEITINSCFGVDANSAMLGSKKLVDNIASAFLYEANSQTLMYEWEADKQMYPASLVKIMTALIAIEKGKLDDIVVASDTALSSVPADAVSAKLQVGEQMSLKDLLYCLLVGSANDAAIVIAEHISGDQTDFVSLMNEYAQEIGCTATNFVNAHGLHDEAQLTTARDVARILDKGMKNDEFRKIFTAKTHRIEATNMSDIRKLETSNNMFDSASKLYYDPRAIGGRTGVTQDGKRCIATAAESNGMLLISVVMGSESVYQEDGYSAISVGGYKETTSLLNAGFGGYKTVQIMYANQAMEQCKIANGDCDLVVGPKESISSVLPVNATVENLTYHYNLGNLNAPITKGDRITAVKIYSGNMCVAETDLYALNSVKKVSEEIYVDGHQQENNYSTIIVYSIVGIVVVGFVVLGIMRYLPQFIKKKHSAQYRRSRRRS